MADENPFKRHKISHSDIKAIHKCEYNWFWQRYKNLMPIDGWPEVMEVGTFGHSLMEAGFEVLLAGGTYEEMVQAAGNLLLDVMESPAKSKVFRNVIAFFAYFLEQPWKIVAIEDKTSFVIDDEREFGFTPDLVAEFTAGPYKGQWFIIDYKFTGQYWTERKISMHQQVPKYITYYNMLHDANVRRGAVVMLNTRATAADTGNKLFLIKWLTPVAERQKRLIRENEIMIERILRYKAYGDTYGDEELKKILVHVGDENACNFCTYADDLCPMDFDGRDVTKVLERNYKQNDTYGYNGETDKAK